MKKLLFFISFIVSLSTFAQTSAGTSDVNVLYPYQTSRVRSSDSVQVSATLVTNHSAVAIQWVQTAGPATVAITPINSWVGGGTEVSGFWLKGLIPGTYSWTATGVSSTGSKSQGTYTLVVVADSACPVCPSIPAPRTVVSLQITINGQILTIPVIPGLMKVGFSDGGVQ